MPDKVFDWFNGIYQVPMALIQINDRAILICKTVRKSCTTIATEALTVAKAAIGPDVDLCSRWHACECVVFIHFEDCIIWNR